VRALGFSAVAGGGARLGGFVLGMYRREREVPREVWVVETKWLMGVVRLSIDEDVVGVGCGWRRVSERGGCQGDRCFYCFYCVHRGGVQGDGCFYSFLACGARRKTNKQRAYSSKRNRVPASPKVWRYTDSKPFLQISRSRAFLDVSPHREFGKYWPQTQDGTPMLMKLTW